MASIQEYRQQQLEKVERLVALGVNPYPARSFRDTRISRINKHADELQGQGACVAGRVTSVREHGKLVFIDIDDSGDELQIIVRDDSLTAEYPKGLLAYSDLSLITRGDFLEVAGVVTRSQSNELSLEAKGVRILSKVLRPLPEKLEDKETRLRRRYLDMAINKDVRARFVRRAKFWQATRDYFNQAGFIEINTPVLEHTTGGADANPFITHMDTLDEDFYLRISHELPLKRLLGGGFDKVYDIGPRFRNEQFSEEHLPEHVALESYAAYQTFDDALSFYEGMMKHVAEVTWGTLQFTINGHSVDLSGEWPRYQYADLMSERFGIDVFNPDLDELKKLLVENKVDLPGDVNEARALDNLWKVIRRESAGPFWMIGEPIAISPLAKQDPQNQEVSLRLHPIIGGSELGNGYAELNDPQEQLSRFVKQQAMRNAGDDEAQMLDIDFVEMLEYGMPPATGWGHSERFFWMFEGVTAREGVPFTHMRREVESSTKDAYPEVYGPEGIFAKSGQRDQDFSKRIVAVVNKALEPWQVANTAAHMSAYHANKMAKDEFDSGEFFVTADNHQLPRNSQHPILIKRADHKDLHKLYQKAKEANLRVHVFIREMIETTNDVEIVESLRGKAIEDVEIYGVALYGDSDAVNSLTKHFQLWN